MIRKLVVSLMLFAGILSFWGCAHWQEVTYSDVKTDNTVRISLVSGEGITGTVKKTEPHQIIILKENKFFKISKSSIKNIKILPPVYDDFGRCISEREIKSVKTNKNAVIYGIGGGALSFGTSFFIGSMLAGEDTSKSGGVLIGTTAAGTGLGTILFVKAGMAKDRKEAIEKVKEKRRLQAQKKLNKKNPETKNIQDMIKKEKEKQEQLQKEREKLLKELKNKKK